MKYIQNRRDFIKRAFAGLIVFSALTSDQEFLVLMRSEIVKAKRKFDRLPLSGQRKLISVLETSYPKGESAGDLFVRNFIGNFKRFLTGGGDEKQS